MKQVQNIALAFFVSPETVVILLIALWLALFPTSLAELGSKLKSDSDVWSYLPTLIFLFSGAAFRFSFKIRAPIDGTSNRVLYEWPLYSLIVARVMVGLFFAVVSAVLVLGLWIYGQSLSNRTVGCLFLLAAGVSATTALTMMLAHQKLRELIDCYGPH